MSETAPDLGAMVSRLLSDPELLSRIATTVGVGGESPIDESAKENTAPVAAAESVSTSAAPLDSLGSLAPLLSLLGGSGGGAGGGKSETLGSNSARRVALLSALKPFCNSHRCQTIDYMISISRLGDTLLSGGR